MQGKIDQEAQARTAADQVLQNNIDSEATTRAAQDLVLDHKIEDVKLQGQADKSQLLEALNTEIQIVKMQTLPLIIRRLINVRVIH